MKTTNELAAMLLLTLVMIACSSTSAIQTVEVTRVVVVTETVQQAAASIEGGFTTGTPVDVATLPALEGMGGDDGGIGLCFVESTEPSISWGSAARGPSLCLNNFPTAPDSPGFTVTLTDPTGRTFSESFTYNQRDIIDSRGTDVGEIQEGSNSESYRATPGVRIWIYMPASFPCGNWSVSASTQDGSINIGPMTLARECRYSQTSVVSSLDINPFRSSAKETFVNGETLYIVGAAYPPNTAITVALYQENPSAGTPEVGYMVGTAKYAVSVMTDNSGSFQAPFLVGNGTLRGAYWAVAAPVITSDIRLSPFGARFSIE
jgi:uncharacterized lipoprotein YbaY